MAYNQSLTATGLTTLTVSVPQAGAGFVKGTLTLPTISQGGGQSSVVTTISQNSTPVYTGVAGAEGFYVDLLFAANDSIAIAFSSSAAPDLPLNVIKAQVQIGSGQ